MKILLILVLSMVLLIMFSALRAASIADEQMEQAYADWVAAHPDKADFKHHHDANG